jgi:hypothetical protein
VLAERRDEQRRAALGILEVGILAVGDQLLDLGHLATGGGGVQARIDRNLALGRCLLGRQRTWQAGKRRGNRYVELGVSNHGLSQAG